MDAHVLLLLQPWPPCKGQAAGKVQIVCKGPRGGRCGLMRPVPRSPLARPRAKTEQDVRDIPDSYRTNCGYLPAILQSKKGYPHLLPNPFLFGLVLKDPALYPSSSVVHEPVRTWTRLGSSRQDARVCSDEMLLTTFLDDVFSTVVSFQIGDLLTWEVAAGGWKMWRPLFWGKIS